MRHIRFEQLDAEARALLTDLRAIPEVARRETRLAAARIAAPVVADARSRFSWSSRIPGAVYVATRFGADVTRVAVKVRARAAPHARAYENLGRPGTFRHPVHGRDTWVAQQARPGLFPAAAAHMDGVYGELVRAFDQAARRHGL